MIFSSVTTVWSRRNQTTKRAFILLNYRNLQKLLVLGQLNIHWTFMNSKLNLSPNTISLQIVMYFGRPVFLEIKQLSHFAKSLLSLHLHVFKEYVCEYIENNTWSRGDMEFIFECSHRYRTSERSERVRYRMWTREDKFHISKRPCIILFII